MFARNILSRGTHKAPIGRRSMGFFSRDWARDIQTGAAALTVLTTFAMAGIGTVRFIFERNKKWNEDYSEFSNLLRTADDEMDKEIKKQTNDEMCKTSGKKKTEKNFLRAQMFAKYCNEEQLSNYNQSTCRKHQGFCLAANRLRTHARQKLHSFMYSKDTDGNMFNPHLWFLPKTIVVEMANVYREIAPLEAANHLQHNKFNEAKGPLCQKIINDYMLVDYSIVIFVNILANDKPSQGFLHFLDGNRSFLKKGSVQGTLMDIAKSLPETEESDEKEIIIRKEPKIVVYHDLDDEKSEPRTGGEGDDRKAEGTSSGNRWWSWSKPREQSVSAVVPSPYGWALHNPSAKQEYMETAEMVRALQKVVNEKYSNE